MAPRTFLAWAAAALVLLAAVIVTGLSERRPAIVAVDREPAFPLLHERPEDVGAIEITAAEHSFRLGRDHDGGWVASDRWNHPVDDRAVADLIVTLADMRLVEAKTTRPDRYERLGVEPVDAEGAQSRLVRVFDTNGEVLTEALVGRQADRIGARQPGTYIRRPDEDRAWLASGGLAVNDQITDWLRRGIVDIARRDVRAVAVTPSSGQGYAAAREDPEADLVLQVDSDALPEDRSIDTDAVNRLASIFASVELTDVRPATDLDLPTERGVASVSTFDGVEVTATIARVDEGSWVVFSARFVSDGAATAADSAGAGVSDDADARLRVEAFNRQVDGWAYRLPDHVVSRMTRSFDDMLRPSPGTS